MILLTGGAGYIGSQLLFQLLDANEDVIVLDNFQTSSRMICKFLPHCHIINGDCGNEELLNNLFQEFPITSIMHLAASTSITESVNNPEKYIHNNFHNTQNLLNVAKKFNIEHFIFSSTAAVYGAPTTSIVEEETPCKPINPYGESKLLAEEAIRKSGINHIILRYFNVAGADPQLRIGPYYPQTTVLIRYAIQVMLGIHDELQIFGNDYPTPDGTGIRDYIHVADIANAHIAALSYLRQNGNSQTFNCGYGNGYSVMEVIETLEAIAGESLRKKNVARREGDPAYIIASTKKIRTFLDWKPEYNTLKTIISHAYLWEKQRIHNIS